MKQCLFRTLLESLLSFIVPFFPSSQCSGSRFISQLSAEYVSAEATGEWIIELRL